MFFASASFVMLNVGAASADGCYLFGTNGPDYLKAPNNGCPYTIVGYAGNDTLIGNITPENFLFPGTNGGATTGKDKMTGGDSSGPDFFVWDEQPGEPATITGDIITDFNVTKGDIIFLGGPCYYLDITCTWIGTSAFSGVAGQVRFQPATVLDSTSQVQADFTGSGEIDFVINLTNGALIPEDGEGISFTLPDHRVLGRVHNQRRTRASAPEFYNLR
jgi:hypothetical protein